MRTRTLQRRATKETVSVEPLSSLDGQGAPSYGSSQDIEAFVKEENELAVAADGSEVRVSLTLWVPGDESPLPGEQDRITRSGSTFIVEVARTATNLRGTTDHVKAVCRDV